jgi:hypothetical protein
LPRSQRTNTRRQSPPPAAIETEILEPDDLTEEEQEAQIQKWDIWEILAHLPDNLRDCLLYVYRTDPITDGEPKAEAKYSARMFDEQTLLKNHGGGGFKLILDARIGGRDTIWKVTRNVQEPGTAKIPARFVIVDDKGATLNAPSTQTGPAAPATKDDLVAAIRASTDASRVGNDAQQKAVDTSFEMMSKTFDRMLDKALTGNDQPKTDPAVAVLLKKVEDLESSIKDQRIAHLEQQISELKEQRANPPAASAPQGEVEILSGAAKLLKVDDGPIGLMKKMADVETKEEGFFDHIGRGLGEGVGAFVRDWGGNLIQLGHEYLQVRRIEAERGTGSTPQTHPAQPQRRDNAPQRLQPQPHQPQTQPQTQEEVVLDITRDISETIVHFLELNVDGATVAEIVKRQFATATVFGFPAMSFITRLEIFQDFNKMLKWCRENPYFEGYVDVPEFEGFAREFFDAFQKQGTEDRSQRTGQPSAVNGGAS